MNGVGMKTVYSTGLQGWEVYLYPYISIFCQIATLYNDIVLLLSSEYMYEFDVAESSMSTI